MCMYSNHKDSYVSFDWLYGKWTCRNNTNESPRKMEGEGEKRGVHPVGLDLPVADTISV